jgi:hypothetical protein
VTYRHKPSFANLNEPLLREFSTVLDRGRSIAALQENLSLLRRAALHAEIVPQDSEERRRWLTKSLSRIKRCGVVFLDPDNGISPHTDCGVKHAAWDEIDRFLSVAKLVMIYHHPGRTGSHDEQIRTLVDRLARRQHVKGAFALRFRLGTSRAFLIASRTEATYRRARTAVEGFLRKSWVERGHFGEVVSADNGE